MLETFKTLAQIAEARNFQVGFVTKKHMIEVMAEFDENGEINYNDDCHWTIWMNGECFSDEEITAAMLKKAALIEFSFADGWIYYIGRNCTQAQLEACFDGSIGWALECGAEFGELTDAQLDTIEAAGVELEFAARNREWNAEEAQEAAQAETVEAEAPAAIQVVIYAGYEYVNKPVASLEEAAALRAEYRAKTPEFDRFSFKCFDPAKVQFDRWGDIIAVGYEV